jgi:hypothetical protein
MRAVRDELIHDFLDDELISYYLTLVHDTKNHLQIKHYKKKWWLNLISIHPSSYINANAPLKGCRKKKKELPKRRRKKKERARVAWLPWRSRRRPSIMKKHGKLLGLWKAPFLQVHPWFPTCPSWSSWVIFCCTMDKVTSSQSSDHGWCRITGQAFAVWRYMR